jgi:hypothetical protein
MNFIGILAHYFIATLFFFTTFEPTKTNNDYGIQISNSIR